MKRILLFVPCLWLFVHCTLVRRDNVKTTIPFYEEVPGWNMPEAAVTALIVTPERAEKGESVGIKAVISNLGTGTTSAILVQFMVDGVEIDRQETAPLTALREVALNTRWPAATPGRHKIEVLLSLDHSTYDGSSSNNQLATLLRVSGEEHPMPEIEVDIPESVLREWETGKTRSNIPVIFRNPGFAHLDNFSVQFYADGEPIGPGQQVNALKPGAEVSIPLQLAPMKPGEHMLSLKMDLPPGFPQRDIQSIKGWSVTIPHPTSLYEVAQKDKWASIGPKVLNDGSVGRINCFAYQPGNPDIMYAGGFGNDGGILAGAGVWKTSNGGKNWFPIGDKLPSMRVTSIAVDPVDPANIYIGTASNGIFKSTDNGTTWIPFADQAITGAYVHEIIVRTAAPNISPRTVMYVACHNGVLRYTNDNPGVKTSQASEWVNIKQGIVTDLAIHPTDRAVLYASIENNGGGLFRTKNAVSAKEETVLGANDWVQLNTLPNNGLPTGLEGWNKIKLDIFQSNPLYVYAGILAPRPGYSFALYRSTIEGEKFDLLAEYPADKLSGIYNPFVRVHPTLSEMVYFGGVDLFKWSAYSPPAGNNSWTYRLQNNQADMKELIFIPGAPAPNKPYEYFSACDQGIFYGTSEKISRSYQFENSTILGLASDNFEARNNNLRVTQIYDFDLSTAPPFRIIAGTQDDGTILYEGNEVWTEVRGGDGWYSLIAPSNTKVMYSQYQFLSSTQRWNERERRWIDIAQYKGLPSDATVDGYITVDPNYPNTVLAAGIKMEDSKKEQQVFVTQNAQLGEQCTWEPKGPSDKALKGSARRIAIQAGTTHWFAGTTKGQIWTTSAKTQGSWSLIDAHPDMASVSSMVFSAADPNVLYVIYDGGSLYHRIQRLVYTAHGGWNGTWITDNLDLKNAGSLRVICGDRFRPDIAYVGTEHGIFRWDGTKPTYDSWNAYNDGFPLTTVVDLKVGPDKRLYAATKGRGAWVVITGP